MSDVHVHPFLVYIPIFLSGIAIVLNLLSYPFKKEWIFVGSVISTIAGSIGALGAVISGLLFTQPLTGYLSTLKDTHVTLAITTTALLIIASAFGVIALTDKEKAKTSYTFTIILLVIAIFIPLTALKGTAIAYTIGL